MDACIRKTFFSVCILPSLPLTTHHTCSALGTVAWGVQERAAEVTHHMALCRFSGHGSSFTSMAPDDVHDPLVIRMCHPSRSPEQFPHGALPDDLLTALHAPIDKDRRNDRFDMREEVLQFQAYKNPIATSACFHSHIARVIKHLIGHDLERKRSFRLDRPTPNTSHAYKGLCGVSSYWSDVTECNKRDSQHIHGKNGAALAPELLADIAVRCTCTSHPSHTSPS